jgi:hypothetical protein
VTLFFLSSNCKKNTATKEIQLQPFLPLSAGFRKKDYFEVNVDRYWFSILQNMIHKNHSPGAFAGTCHWILAAI